MEFFDLWAPDAVGSGPPAMVDMVGWAQGGPWALPSTTSQLAGDGWIFPAINQNGGDLWMVH